MKILSLFDGISCGYLALKRAGLPVTKYFASEIDRYAITVSKNNFPDIIHLGDCRNVFREMLPPIDILIGGSPCQGFSFAGKQLNFSDPRSALFFEYLRLLNELKPTYFLLENVKMKKEYEQIISNCLGVDPIEINSSRVSAQNRKRLYWTNIPNIDQPQDKGILLKDILETPNSSGVLRNKNRIIPKNNKSNCIDANYHKGPDNHGQRTQILFSKQGLCHIGDTANIKGNESIERVYHPDGKALTLSTCRGGNREPKVMCGAFRGRYKVDGVRQDGKMKCAGLTKQELEIRKDNKTNAITTVQKDNVVTYDCSNMQGSIYDIYWRKLTVVECERLQTLPDNYTQGISNTQRYKCLGNAWTVDVIAHIFSNIKKTLII